MPKIRIHWIWNILAPWIRIRKNIWIQVEKFPPPLKSNNFVIKTLFLNVKELYNKMLPKKIAKTEHLIEICFW